MLPVNLLTYSSYVQEFQQQYLMLYLWICHPSSRNIMSPSLLLVSDLSTLFKGPRLQTSSYLSISSAGCSPSSSDISSPAVVLANPYHAQATHVHSQTASNPPGPSYLQPCAPLYR